MNRKIKIIIDVVMTVLLLYADIVKPITLFP